MPDLSDDTFRDLCAYMHGTVGLHFAANKRNLVKNRLAQRISQLGLSGFREYLDLISGVEDAGEFQKAVDLLTTNETYFFREQAHFDLIEREFNRCTHRSPKLWSAAASFGDEAFSLAMLLADMEQQGHIGCDWSIVGTDISDRVLRGAVQAIYPHDRLRHVSPERLRRYCLRGEGDAEGMVQMQSRLRERVRFGQLNLCRDFPSLGGFDVVMMRNVLIYFDAETKRAVVDRVLTQLHPGGLFFIGSAEGRLQCNTPLEILAPGAFRKRAR